MGRSYGDQAESQIHILGLVGISRINPRVNTGQYLNFCRPKNISKDKLDVNNMISSEDESNGGVQQYTRGIENLATGL
jgi:hypothetical protein